MDARNAAWSDLAERTEAAAMGRMATDQPAEVVELLGVSAAALADGVHTIVVRDPMWGYWNKALGFCRDRDGRDRRGGGRAGDGRGRGVLRPPAPAAGRAGRLGGDRRRGTA